MKRNELLSEITSRYPVHTLRPGENDETIEPLGPGIAIIARETGSESWIPQALHNSPNNIVAVAKNKLVHQRPGNAGYFYALLIPIAEPGWRTNVFASMQSAFEL